MALWLQFPFRLQCLRYSVHRCEILFNVRCVRTYPPTILAFPREFPDLPKPSKCFHAEVLSRLTSRDTFKSVNTRTIGKR